jgi:hypothetical protein
MWKEIVGRGKRGWKRVFKDIELDPGYAEPNYDGFVKSPNFCVALHPSSLQRTVSTPHSSRFARLEFEAFYFAIEF